MNKYVVGFLIHGRDVALIRKQHPGWQKGFLNGIGGHIEPGEKPLGAMVREFYEETGVTIGLECWHEFVCVKGTDYELHCFSSETGAKWKLKAENDEKPGWFNMDAILKQGKILANLKWLIPMAAYKFKLRGEIWHDNPEC